MTFLRCFNWHRSSPCFFLSDECDEDAYSSRSILNNAAHMNSLHCGGEQLVKVRRAQAGGGVPPLCRGETVCQIAGATADGVRALDHVKECVSVGVEEGVELLGSGFGLGYT